MCLFFISILYYYWILKKRHLTIASIEKANQSFCLKILHAKKKFHYFSSSSTNSSVGNW